MIERLESRARELRAQLESIAQLPQAQRDAVASGINTLLKEIEERIVCLQAGKPDPFA